MVWYFGVFFCRVDAARVSTYGLQREPSATSPPFLTHITDIIPSDSGARLCCQPASPYGLSHQRSLWPLKNQLPSPVSPPPHRMYQSAARGHSPSGSLSRTVVSGALSCLYRRLPSRLVLDHVSSPLVCHPPLQCMTLPPPRGDPSPLPHQSSSRLRRPECPRQKARCAPSRAAILAGSVARLVACPPSLGWTPVVRSPRSSSRPL